MYKIKLIHGLYKKAEKGEKFMMNKRFKKLMNSVAATAMALTVLMGSTINVSAEWVPQTEDKTSGGYVEGKDNTSAEAYISKNLIMAEGMNIPVGSFSFHFDPTSFDESTTEGDIKKLPDIADKTISYTEKDGEDNTILDSNRNIQIKKVTSEDILKDLTFPIAGKYVYTVTENESYAGYTFQNGEYFRYSQAQYKMTVVAANKVVNGEYVEIKDDTGKVTGYETYVKYVVVNKELNDAGKKEEGKVNPSQVAKDNGFTFENTFIRVGNTIPTPPGDDTPNPDDPDAPGTPDQNHNALTISKKVTGEMSVLTDSFDFTINLIKSGTEAADVSSYVAYKYIDGVKQSEPIEVPVGKDEPFKLKHNEALVFPTLPTGTRYVVKETAADYDKNLVSKEDGGTDIEKEVNKGTDVIDNTDDTNKSRLVGDEENYAKFTNEKPYTAPMGVLINNLPFIMLIVVALGAFAAFVVSRKRKSTH